MHEKYRDMKNKFEMRIHERNMKIDDLKSQIQHSLLYQ
jgi:ribosomal protein S10